MPETDYAIRLARAEELPALREIERAAGRLFAEIGLDNVANANPLPLDFLQAQQSAGMVWVLTNADDQPVGFAAASELDGALYLEEIDVHPAHGRRGLGRRLIETLCIWAEERGYPAVTLSTFRDVPWNAPFYSRLGFRIIEDGEMGPGLQALLDHSTRVWFPLARVCMRRDLQGEARQGD
jgi:GNAT superfamily N-acetyltransferase